MKEGFRQLTSSKYLLGSGVVCSGVSKILGKWELGNDQHVEKCLIIVIMSIHRLDFTVQCYFAF